jgi:transcriptional regulator with XRE-family HTH domain
LLTREVGFSIYTPEYRVFAALLRQLREEAGLTQDELGARLGRDQPWVSVVESGRRRVDVVELRAICRVLHVEMGDFLALFETRLAKKT